MILSCKINFYGVKRITPQNKTHLLHNLFSARGAGGGVAAPGAAALPSGGGTQKGAPKLKDPRDQKTRKHQFMVI